MWFPRRRHIEATPPVPAADRPPAVQRDWAAIPALQRIGTDMDGVVDTGFEADLSSWHSPAVLRPLDHALSEDAPSGMVLNSIARSVLAGGDSSSAAPPSGPAAPVQRTVLFEPPRRPTVTFSADPPRTIPALTFEGGDEPPAPVVVAPDLPVFSDRASPTADLHPAPIGDEAPEGEHAPASAAVEVPSMAADPPEAVAPTLGEVAPAPAATAGPPASLPIQRTSQAPGRPIGLGPPARSPEAPVVRGAPSLAVPSPVPSAGASAPVTGPPTVASSPTAPGSQPVVQREAAAPPAVERLGGVVSDDREPAPPAPDVPAAGEPAPATAAGEADAAGAGDAAAPAAPAGEAVAAPLAAAADEDGPAPVDVAGGSATATTTPLLGGQPPLLGADTIGAEPSPSPESAGPGHPLAATSVVETPRAGLGEPRHAVEPAPAAPVQRAAVDRPSFEMTGGEDAEEFDQAGEPAAAPASVAPAAAPASVAPAAAPASVAPAAAPASVAPAAASPSQPLVSATTPITEQVWRAAVPAYHEPLPPAPSRQAAVLPVAPSVQRLAPSTPTTATTPGGPGTGTRSPAESAPVGDAVAPTLGGSLEPILAPLPGGGPASPAPPMASGAQALTAEPWSDTAGPTPTTTVQSFTAAGASLTAAVPAPTTDATAPTTDALAPITDALAPTTVAPAASVVGLVGQRSLGSVVAGRPGPRLDGGVQRLATAAPSPALATAPAPPSFGSGTSAPSGPGESWVDAGSAAIEAGVAQRQADGSVVFSTGLADAAEPSADVGPTGDVVQRAADASSRAPAAAGGGADGGDLDELAKRLYGRLRVMLKHELRLDRERAGVLTQVRR